MRNPLRLSLATVGAPTDVDEQPFSSSAFIEYQPSNSDTVVRKLFSEFPNDFVLPRHGTGIAFGGLCHNSCHERTIQ